MSPDASGRISVVLDINVYIDYVLGARGSLRLPDPDDVPSGFGAADAIALAFDDRFKLFTSPHILSNISRILADAGQSVSTRERFIAFVVDVCHESGGGVVAPLVEDFGIGDHEDNNILALATDPAVDADIIVSRDHHLTDLGPAWRGRLVCTPNEFVRRLVSGR